MFGMHKGTQGMHLQLHLTTREKKNNNKKKRNIPFHVGNPDHETIGMDWLHCLCGIIIIIINLPKRKAYAKGKACTRCPPTKKNIHIPTVHYKLNSTLQTKQYTTKHKTVIRKLLDT